MNTGNNYKSDPEKIYEKLEYREQPSDYAGKLPWLVQMQIAATNGKQYADRVGKLKDYPKYELPVKKVENGLMLDIGCGWGRWLVSGAEKGYLPIGVDLRVEFCEATLQTLQAQNCNGYVVAADLMQLPFVDGIFDLVWSFSVIQHTHQIRFQNCLNEIYRILKRNGFTKLEFPNKEGFRNKRGPVKNSEKNKDVFDSWVVRYYSIREYKEKFMKVFGNFKYSVHSFLGIGVLKEDIRYVNLKSKILCSLSLILTRIAKSAFGMKKKADSIYIESVKQGETQEQDAIIRFLDAHASNPLNNLNVLYLLRCPNTGESLILKKEDRGFVYNLSGTYKYPLINSVPVIIKSEGSRVEA